MQKFYVRAVFILLTAIFPLSGLSGQEGYTDHENLSARLNNLGKEYPSLANVRSLAKTDGGKDIWLLSIGAGDPENRPAIAVFGGVSGKYPAGTELALLFAEKILESSGSEEVNKILSETVFYVFPDMNPDARAQFFAPLRYERTGNAYPQNALEREPRLSEDPYSDLNGDNMITLMRVEDPSGKWIPHPDDERIMKRASVEKGETGKYKLFTEGVDGDLQELFNFHREGMVNFNRNFTFQYPEFSPEAGHHAISEIESRAAADFLFNAKNVFAVVSFGPADNLTAPLTYNERAASGRMVTGILQKDAAVNSMVSNTYKDLVSTGVSAGNSGTGGDFFQWAYFHYGRFSFSTPGWWIPKTGEGTTDPQVNFLRWAESEGLENVFVPWQEVANPEFPERKTEVGGIAPFVMKNPPYEYVETSAGEHYRFLLELAKMKPAIDIVNVRTETLGRDFHRITVDVFNEGIFPTVTELGQRIRWVQKTVIDFDPDNGQELVSGKRVEVLDQIEGKGKVERSWLVRGRGSVNIRAGAESTGFRKIEIKL